MAEPIEAKRMRKVGFTQILGVSLVAYVCFAVGGLRTTAGDAKTIRDEIQARRFVLVDGAGKERGEFGIMQGGEPALRIWDEGRTMIATLEIDHAGMPRLAFESVGGAPLPVIALGVQDKRHPVFMLYDGDGRRRVGMAVGEAGAAIMGLYDTRKRNRCSLFFWICTSGEDRFR